MIIVAFNNLSVKITKWSSVGQVRASFGLPVNILSSEMSSGGPVYLFERINDSSTEIEVSPLAFEVDSESGMPTVLAAEWGSALWVGCNNSVYRISQELALDNALDLDSRFASFRIHSPTSQLIVIAETMIVALSEDGNANWLVSLDVITDVRWADRSVVLTQMDGPEVTVDLATGEVTPKL